MSLDPAKLEKARELAGGIVQARCPACAEDGGDRKGEHLRVYPDGRYGCCVHPKDTEHRKRVFALAGVRESGTFGLRLVTAPTLPVVKSVRSALTDFFSGTPGTPKTESEKGGLRVSMYATDDFGTLGTDNSELRARTGGNSTVIVGDHLRELKDWETAVPSVPKKVALPYLTESGDLVIPFNSPERYHWWTEGGQTIRRTRAELRERKENDASPF
jgi:hypothetical protein